MEQDITSISWKGLPWKKFQKKSFRFQCKIYKAKQNNNPKLVRRLQKLLLNSKSLYYLIIRKVSQNSVYNGLFLSDERKLLLAEEIHAEIKNRKYKFIQSSTRVGGFRKSFNFSLFRDKVLESLWKFVMMPVCVEYSFDLNRNFIQEFNCNPQYQNKKALRLSIIVDINSINFSELMSDLWLPLRYKTKLCKLLKRYPLKITSSYEDLILTLFNNLFTKIEELSCIPTKIHRGLHTSYVYKLGFHHDIQRFYVFKKSQNLVGICQKIQALLKSRGIDISLNRISLKEVNFDFSFLYLYFNLTKGRKSLLSPSSTNWYICKKRITYILKQEQISWYLKVKKLKCTLITWIQSNNLYSKSELKSRFFYLKKSLANHI